MSVCKWLKQEDCKSFTSGFVGSNPTRHTYGNLIEIGKLVHTYCMRTKYTKELLEQLVKESTSVAQVIRKLGLKEAGGTHSHLSRKIRQFEIDTSHFLGCASNCGEGHKGGSDKRTHDEILILRESGNRQKSFRLRRALIEAGTKYECEICGLDGEWNGQELRLEIDHKNNNWLDDRKDNLRFCCPNCHSQQKHKMNQGHIELTSSARYDRTRRQRPCTQNGKAI